MNGARWWYYSDIAGLTWEGPGFVSWGLPEHVRHMFAHVQGQLGLGGWIIV